MTKSRKKDQFLYALLAVVFAAAALIVVKDFSFGRTAVLGVQTP